MYLEDIELGQTIILEPYIFTEEEIIDFGRKYDPQYFHVDPIAAKDSHFGGLVASGFHIGAVWMKLMISHRMEQMAKLESSKDKQTGGVSPGFLKMRWPNPVRPGDAITYSSTTFEKVELKSRPHLGIIRSMNKGVNQDGKTVLTFIGQGMMPRRPSGGNLT
jgi:acyl dehydratase